MNTYGLNESMFISREQYLEAIIQKSQEEVKILKKKIKEDQRKQKEQEYYEAKFAFKLREFMRKNKLK